MSQMRSASVPELDARTNAQVSYMRHDMETAIMCKDLSVELRDFKPTADQINALPEGIREYIMRLETFCDPAGIIANQMLTSDACNMLIAENRSLKVLVSKQACAHSDICGTFSEAVQ